MGFRYLASSVPILCLTGVSIGVGLIFSSLIYSTSRNPAITNNLIRWSFIGFSLVEVSGFIGLVYSFLLLYALIFLLFLVNGILLISSRAIILHCSILFDISLFVTLYSHSLICLYPINLYLSNYSSLTLGHYSLQH